MDPNVPDNPRFARYVSDAEYKAHDGKYSPATFLPLPLEFGDPEQLHRQIVGTFNQVESDWSEAHPEFEAIAIYMVASDEDEEIWVDANPSDTEEFFVVDLSDPDCPVFLWTHDTPFRDMDRVAPTLDEFLAALTDARPGER